MAWIAPTPAMPDGPVTGPERPMLEGYLNYQRHTLLNICAGLTADQLAAAPLESTNLTLLGVVRHLTKVERIWFRIRAAATGIEPVFDPDLGKDYDFEHIDPADAEQAVAQLEAEWREGDVAVAELDLDHLVPARDYSMSLRMMYLHVINEYARHNGHADVSADSRSTLSLVSE
jgi:uncharacterized damage-inducible protein DinB